MFSVTSQHNIFCRHMHLGVVGVIAVPQFHRVALLSVVAARTLSSNPVLEGDFEKLNFLILGKPNSTKVQRYIRYQPLSAIMNMERRIEFLNRTCNSPNGITTITPLPSSNGSSTSLLAKTSLEFSTNKSRPPASPEHTSTSSIHHIKVPTILCDALYRRGTVLALLIIPRH